MMTLPSECVYGGQTSLILCKAHENLAKSLPDAQRNEYWKQEGIWKESKAAFDKYFRATPWPDMSAQSRLLLMAYRTRQWQDFLSLYSEMKTVDESVFGSKEFFDRALA